MVSEMNSNPELWTEEDLEVLSKILKNADFAAFGEAVHTSDGFYKSKVRVFKHLIKNCGFRTIAFETPWGEALDTDKFISRNSDNIHVALQGLFRVWRSVSVSEFLIWLRDWNKTNPAEKVTFIGFDIQQPQFDFNSIKSTLEKKSNNFYDFVNLSRDLYGNSLKLEKPFFNSTFLNEIKNGKASDKLIPLKNLTDFLDTFSAETINPLTKLSMETFKAFSTYIINWNLGQHSSDDELVKKAFALRDSTMTNVLDFFYQKNPNKTLIWAHNLHIMRPHRPKYQGCFGQFCNEKWSDRYKAIAIVSSKMDINWPWLDWARPPEISEGSIEIAIEEQGTNSFIFDANAIPSWAKNCSKISGNIEYSKIKDIFDGLIYIPYSPAIQYADDLLT